MEKIKLFFNKNSELPIENRLFDSALIVTVSFFVFWSVYSLFSDYTLIIKLIYWCGLLVSLGLFLANRLTGAYKTLTAIYYSSFLGLLAFSWLPAGGLDGPIFYWFFLAYVSGLLVLPIRIYLVYLITSIAIVATFSWMELQHPGLAAPYASTALRLKDLFVASMVSLFIVGLAMLVFKKSYAADRKRLKKLIEDLEVEKIKAESADQSKSQFLATISHEMRTPLNGIVGITELIQKTPLNEEQKEMIQNLSYSSRQLHSIISDVLDLTLIEDNKLIINNNEINVKKEIASIIELVNPLLLKKKGRVEITFDRDKNLPPLIYGDDIRLRQILINLINNALKFTEKGTIKVESRLTRAYGETIWIYFSITDSGEGIPQEKQALIFNKFYKARADSEIEGTGLGLSICKNLVELMNGTIGFDSIAGKGSVFFFELPFSLVSKDGAFIGAEIKDCDLSGMKVLLAEDTPINQMVASKMLKNLGITDFDIADNGQRAVEMSREKNYDIILMDLQMPIMKGIDAAKAILGHPQMHHPIIIPLTANVLVTDLQECEKAGMTDFISKPFQSETLKAVLCRNMPH